MKQNRCKDKRRQNPAYTKKLYQVRKIKKEITYIIEKGNINENFRLEEKKSMLTKLKAELHTIPSVDFFDPGYRRFSYIRYGDEALVAVSAKLGFVLNRVRVEIQNNFYESGLKPMRITIVPFSNTIFMLGFTLVASAPLVQTQNIRILDINTNVKEQRSHVIHIQFPFETIQRRLALMGFFE
jgi:hypothetical protein